MPRRTPNTDVTERGHSTSNLLLFVLILFFLFALSSAQLSAETKAPQPSQQDQSCLACHGEAGMKSDKGKSLFVDPAKHAASLHGVLGCTDCHTSIKEYPHPAKIAKVQCATCHEEEATHAAASVHGAVDVSCQSCHGNVHEVTRGCATCARKVCAVPRRRSEGVPSEYSRAGGCGERSRCSNLLLLPRRGTSNPNGKR